MKMAKYKCWNCKEIVVIPEKVIPGSYTIPLFPGREFTFNFPEDVTQTEFDFILSILSQFREVMAVAPDIREAGREQAEQPE
jgi:hypothetical protein